MHAPCRADWEASYDTHSHVRQIVPVVAATMLRSTRGEMTAPRLDARRAALGIFVAVEAFAFVFYMVLGRFAWFSQDEWDFLAGRTAWDLGDLFRPHNEHWSTLPI